MRVLLLLNSFEPDGPNHLMLGIASRVARHPDIDLRVAALSRGGPLRPRFEEAGIPATVVRARPGNPRRLFAWAEYEAASGWRPDVLHTSLLWPDLAGRLVRQRLRPRVLLSTCHGLHAAGEKGAFSAIAYRTADALTRHRTDGIVAVSPALAEELNAKVPLPVRIIPNGVDAARFHPRGEENRRPVRAHLGLRPEALLAGCAGNLIPLKGQRVLIESAARMDPATRRLHVLLMGDGPERAELQSFAAARGLAGRVHFIGRVRTALPRLMAALDLYVQPSRTESFGLAAAEAMACGIPVVASRVGGLQDLLPEDNSCGSLVPPDRPQELARVMAEWLQNPERRSEAGRAARRRIQERFTIEGTADAYACYWREMLAERPAR